MLQPLSASSSQHASGGGEAPETPLGFVSSSRSSHEFFRFQFSQQKRQVKLPLTCSLIKQAWQPGNIAVLRLETEVQMCTNSGHLESSCLRKGAVVSRGIIVKMFGNCYLKSLRDNENNMSPGGKKNVSAELEHCVAASVIILRAPHSGAARGHSLEPHCVPVQAHTCASRGARGAVWAPLRGSLLVRAPSWTQMPIFQEQALTSACDCLVGLSS